MSDLVEITFTALESATAGRGTLVCFAGKSLDVRGVSGGGYDGVSALVAKAAPVAGFKGKPKSALDLLAPAGIDADRLMVVGWDEEGKAASHDWVTLGGVVMGKLKAGAAATVLFDIPGGDAAAAAAFALGLKLRAYKFDRYKSKKADKEDEGVAKVTIAVRDVEAARAAAASLTAISEGVYTARSLTNEPPNVLFPVEYARRAADLSRLGVEIEVLDQAALEKIGMRALLAVGQGSRNESRVVIMRWNGGAPDQKPVAKTFGCA